MKELNLNQVKNFIKNADRTVLKEIAKVHNQALKSIVAAEQRQFKVGDTVKIDHAKFKGSNRVFTVTSVNKRTVSVKDVISSFRVSASLLYWAQQIKEESC